MINYLNSTGPGEVSENAPVGPPFLDVDDDLFVSPLDVLEVISYLNQQSQGEAEPSTSPFEDQFSSLMDTLALDVATARKRLSNFR